MCGQAAAGLHAAALQRALLRGRTGRVGSKKAKPFKPNPSRLYYPCARVSLCSSWFGRFWVEPLIHAERSIWVLNEAPATVTITQRGCTQLNSTQLNSTQLNSTQLNSTPSLPWPLKTCDTQIYCCLGPSKCGIGKAKCWHSVCSQSLTKLQKLFSLRLPCVEV